MPFYDYTVDSIKKSLFTGSMALRVLLADESTTIKKVVQLTLQDFDVDVRSVSVGLDVLSVAKTFHPDIVMADVLLAKRSGYEVCHDLKNDPETSSLPVVLMWSGFMEIDEQKARLCGADRRIEKPFDPTALRTIVNELVPKTQSNPVSSYVHFPPLPEFQESPNRTQQPTTPSAIPARPENSGSGVQNIGSPTPEPSIRIPFPGEASPESHQPLSMQGLEPTRSEIRISPAPSGAGHEGSIVLDDNELESQDEWIQQPPPSPARPASIPSSKAPEVSSLSAPIPAEEFSEFPLTAQPQKTAAAIADSVAGMMGGSNDELLREEISKWLATHMPIIAERIIREEINRLLKDSEQSIENS